MSMSPGNKYGEPVVCGFARSFGQRMGDAQRVEWIKPIMFTAGGIYSVYIPHSYIIPILILSLYVLMHVSWHVECNTCRQRRPRSGNGGL